MIWATSREQDQLVRAHDKSVFAIYEPKESHKRAMAPLNGVVHEATFEYERRSTRVQPVN
jgi:hypothetical protein